MTALLSNIHLLVVVLSQMNSSWSIVELFFLLTCSVSGLSEYLPVLAPPLFPPTPRSARITGREEDRETLLECRERERVNRCQSRLQRIGSLILSLSTSGSPPPSLKDFFFFIFEMNPGFLLLVGGAGAPSPWLSQPRRSRQRGNFSARRWRVPRVGESLRGDRDGLELRAPAAPLFLHLSSQRAVGRKDAEERPLQRRARAVPVARRAQRRHQARLPEQEDGGEQPLAREVLRPLPEYTVLFRERAERATCWDLPVGRMHLRARAGAQVVHNREGGAGETGETFEGGEITAVQPPSHSRASVSLLQSELCSSVCNLLLFYFYFNNNNKTTFLVFSSKQQLPVPSPTKKVQMGGES